jgi:Phosphotransferase enzyme family
MAPVAAEELPVLAALSSAQLNEITSRVTGQPVPDSVMSVRPVAYNWSSPATAGLWRVDVRASAGTASYIYFVKLLRHTRLWPGLKYLPDDASRADFIEHFPWRAELDMYESDIGAVLPEGMRTPVLHHVGYPDADHIALWWEYVPQRPGPWQLADYRRAAYLLGRLAARRREGAEVNRGLPEVCRVPLGGGSALRYYTESRVLRGMVPALCGEALWQHPAVVAAMQRTADPVLPGQLRALAAGIPQLLDLLDTLPLAHPHGDASPQNLLLPVGEPDAVVVIDWGLGTLLPVGFDLGQLLAGLAQVGEADAGELAAIDAVIFPAYLDGLADEGYQVADSIVRTGYIGGLAARSALCTLPVELLFASPESAATGPAEDTVTTVERGLRLARVLVDLAAELPSLAVVTTPASSRPSSWGLREGARAHPACQTS